MLAVPESDAVAPVDGDNAPTADVAETPEIEAEILGITAPVLDVPALPVKDADASPPDVAKDGVHTPLLPGAKILHGFRLSFAHASRDSGRDQRANKNCVCAADSFELPLVFRPKTKDPPGLKVTPDPAPA